MFFWHVRESSQLEQGLKFLWKFMLGCKFMKGFKVALLSRWNCAVELSAGWTGNGIVGFADAVDQVNVHNNGLVITWA